MTEEDNNIDPSLYLGSAMNTQNQDFLRFQLDVTAELKFLMFDLMGYEWDEKSEKYVRNDDKVQMINLEGANSIMTFLRPRVTRIFSLSNHDSEDIDIRCLRYINDLSFMLCRHKDSYKIYSYQVMDNIIDVCDDIFRATVLKSLQGWEGDSIRKGHQTVESKQEIVPRKQSFGFIK